MKEWNNKFTLQFLEFYQSEPILWDPLHAQYKDKKENNDAWLRLSEQLQRPVAELKKKKDSLMATFRGHLRKKKASMKSGAGEDKIYKPVWFAFKFMEDFLAPVYGYEANNMQPLKRQFPSSSTVSTAKIKTEAGEKSIVIEPTPRILASDDEEFSAFGITVAAKLKRMDEIQRVYAENLINQVLFRGQIKKLTEMTIVTDTTSYEHVVSVNPSHMVPSSCGLEGMSP